MTKQVRLQTGERPSRVERIRWNDLVLGAAVLALCALILVVFAVNAASVRAGAGAEPLGARLDLEYAQVRARQADAARWSALAQWYAAQAEPVVSPTCVPPLVQIAPDVWGCAPRN
jgi:hypothetical protein